MSFFTTLFGGADRIKTVATSTADAGDSEEEAEMARRRARLAALHRQGRGDTVLTGGPDHPAVYRKQLLGE